MRWNIGISLVSFTIAYIFFGTYVPDKESSIQNTAQPNAHTQKVVLPKFFPATETLGHSNVNHIEFLKREPPALTEKNEHVNELPREEKDASDLSEIRVDDIYNSVAEIYGIAVEGDVEAIEKLTVLGMINPGIIPDWIDPYDLIIQHNLKESDYYLYALINKGYLGKAFSVAEEKYQNGDFDAGKHLALFLYHDARFLKDQNPIHFSTWGITQDVHRASKLLIDMCAEKYEPACNLVSELVVSG